MDLVRARLATHRLVAPFFERPIDVVRSLVAVQAQDYAAGLWAIGQRTANGTRADVEAALADRSLVRSWPMRGTLHVVCAEDIRWLLGLLAPRVVRRAASRHRQLGLAAKDFTKSRTLFEKHLAGGAALTRAELFAILGRAKIATAEQRGIHILNTLAMERVLCFGAHRGKQPTFALLDEWIPRSRELGTDEALGELATRYFGGHGPATIADFAWWTGLSQREAKRAIDIARVDVAAPPVRGHAGRATAHLLSAWDEYTVGYRDRSAILDPADVAATTNGLRWVVALDGRIAGVWKRDGAEVRVEPFGRVSPAHARSLDRAAARYRRYSAPTRA